MPFVDGQCPSRRTKKAVVWGLRPKNSKNLSFPLCETAKDRQVLRPHSAFGEGMIVPSFFPRRVSMPSATSNKRKRQKPYLVQKPNGQLSARVQAVGPEHFGIVAVDCAKARSKLMLANFYGTPLVDPTTFEHSQGELQAMLQRLRTAIQDHHLRDVVVAIERTGE